MAIQTVPHAFVEVTTQQTINSASFVDVPGAIINQSNFVAGRKYLLVITSQISNANNESATQIRLVHGSTGFTESDEEIEIQDVDSRGTWFFFTVWTAIASEDIKVQLLRRAGLAQIDQVTMFALEISEELTENTDWFFDEDITNLLLTTTFSTANNAEITFTPPNAGDDWLILASGTIANNAFTDAMESRIKRSGEASDVATQVSREVEGVFDIYQQTMARIFNLGNASNTFTQQSRNAIANRFTNQRTRSVIFAINLSKFTEHSFNYTQGEIDPVDTPDFGTEVQTNSITPTNLTDVWCFGYFHRVGGVVNGIDKARMQIDNVDQPPTQTADGYLQLFGWDVSDELWWALQSIENLDATPHNIDLDVSAVNASVKIEDRLVFAVQLTTGVPVPLPPEIGNSQKSISTDGIPKPISTDTLHGVTSRGE